MIPDKSSTQAAIRGEITFLLKEMIKKSGMVGPRGLTDEAIRDWIDAMRVASPAEGVLLAKEPECLVATLAHRGLHPKARKQVTKEMCIAIGFFMVGRGLIALDYQKL